MLVARQPTFALPFVELYHRPYDQVISFSAELSRRLRGKIDPLISLDRDVTRPSTEENGGADHPLAAE
jgi:hypothetical protein